MTLTNPTDEQLDAAFAEKVAGWMWRDERGGAWFLKSDEQDPDRWVRVQDEKGADIAISGLRFTHSLDAVLPFLKKPFDDGRLWGVSIHRAAVDCMWRVTIREGLGGYSLYTPEHTGMDDSLAKAAVIALLRAHGMEITFK